eukprot:12761767-Alexandrium_andersonii.AAC.1
MRQKEEVANPPGRTKASVAGRLEHPQDRSTRGDRGTWVMQNRSRRSELELRGPGTTSEAGVDGDP